MRPCGRGISWRHLRWRPDRRAHPRQAQAARCASDEGCQPHLPRWRFFASSSTGGPRRSRRVRTAAASSLKSERDAFFCRGVSGDAAVAELGFTGLGTGLPDRPGLPGRPGLRPRGADAARPFDAAAPKPAIFGTGDGGSATGGGGAGGITPAPGRRGSAAVTNFESRCRGKVAKCPYCTRFRVREKEGHHEAA
jgi:hypothetical protein